MPIRPAARSKGGQNCKFHIEFKSAAQKMAWAAFQQHSVLFMTGPAGVGKSMLAMAFAASEVLEHRKKRIIITRPIVEAGERLGYLPGDFNDKVNPYMFPLYDCLTKIVGPAGEHRDLINERLEVSPLAYLRGRTFDDAVCILDESQNATMTQFRLFLSRMGENSKIIVTGDPTQSDIGSASGLSEVVSRLEGLTGIGIIQFHADSIVRHPLVGAMLEKLA